MVPLDLDFMNHYGLRFGVGTLEQLANQNDMQNIADPDLIDLIRRELKVEVIRFCFSPIAVANIINAIRSQMMDGVRIIEQ